MLTVHAHTWLFPCYPADYRLRAWQVCCTVTPATVMSMCGMISPSGGSTVDLGVRCFAMRCGSYVVVSLDSVAALPVTQACVGTCIILECQGKGLPVNVLLPALFNTRCCLHEKGATLSISDVCHAWLLVEVGEDLCNEGVC